jgi:MtN3 and saliva related transmembrane protein
VQDETGGDDVADLIGWSAAFILLLTIGRQVYTQWRDRASAGVSNWLFIGQMAASLGFVVYSWMLHSWIFLATNMMMLVVAVVGQGIHLRNRRQV